MDHSYFKDRISAYHDRDLPPYELQVVEEHLKECAECRASLAEFEQLDQMVAEKSELADADYWEQSAQRIEKALGFEEKAEVVDVRPRSWRGLGWKIATVAASLAVITFIGLHQGDILRDETPSGPVLESDSPPRKTRYMTTPPKSKIESVSDSAASPVTVEDADVGKSDDRDQLLETKVMEKSGTSIQAAPKDAPEEVVKREGGDTPKDLSQTQSDEVGNVLSRPPAADSESKRQAAVAMPQTAPTLSPKEDEVAFAKEKVARGLATAEAVDADLAELPALRQKRDSLMGLYRARYEADTSGQVEQMALMADKRAAVAKATAPDSTARLFERELVDIHYRIAQVSRDKSEREASVLFLKAYADRTDVPYAARARRYLESISPADE